MWACPSNRLRLKLHGGAGLVQTANEAPAVIRVRQILPAGVLIGEREGDWKAGKDGVCSRDVVRISLREGHF